MRAKLFCVLKMVQLIDQSQSFTTFFSTAMMDEDEQNQIEPSLDLRKLNGTHLVLMPNDMQ